MLCLLLCLFICHHTVGFIDSVKVNRRNAQSVTNLHAGFKSGDDDAVERSVRERMAASSARGATALVLSLSASIKAHADGAGVTASSNVYTDVANGYSLYVPEGWSKMPRSVPSTKLSKYAQEESLFVATQFAEGAALSVTRSNARKLLFDFNIDWYFAPIDDIRDIGSPALIAELLVLQRQGDFEKKQTPSIITDARVGTDNALEFDFDTPLAASVIRRTLVRTVFDPVSLQLTSVWSSALQAVHEGDYGEELRKIRASLRRLQDRSS